MATLVAIISVRTYEGHANQLASLLYLREVELRIAPLGGRNRPGWGNGLLSLRARRKEQEKEHKYTCLFQKTQNFDAKVSILLQIKEKNCNFASDKVRYRVKR